MAPRISLALAIHNHQPVGNFDWVVADVHDRAYQPMLAALERHPGVSIALHYSGPLLEWLRSERPAFIVRLRALVERGQVELLGGGWFEPILASLPERDRLVQLVRMGDELEATFGLRPTGAWLAERVWEPDLPATLVAAGYHWTILDDSHFRAAGIAEDRLWGSYTTEDQGRPLTVFGTEQGLRYRIPFGPVDDVIAYLREHATETGERIGMMGDDGEKFGAWPTTWEHCWGNAGWVDRFFGTLEDNADWLTTLTPSAWLAGTPPIGLVYLPTGSYEEMGEWALPPDEALAFGSALRQAKQERRPEARWQRGGFWRSFLTRYREINDLHKQMLRISGKVAAMPHGPERQVAEDHLGRGQSNDCYWHGLFGGIYLSHMRLATHGHLIAAEDLADRTLSSSTAARLEDLDLDGRDEVLLADAGQVVTVDLAEGAGIGSWDIRAARHAVTAVLRRRREAYHDRLPAAEASPAAGESAAGLETASIHELVRAKEAGLRERLHLDPFERRSGLIRLLPADATTEDWAAGRASELGDAVDGPFVVRALEPGRLVVARDATITLPSGAAVPVRIEKRLLLGGERTAPSLSLAVVVEHRGDRPLEARLGIEWSTTMLGGGGNPAAWWDLNGIRMAHDAPGSAPAVSSLAQGNDQVGIAIATDVEPAADAWWAPIETVSSSESGFERVYQGAGLLVSRVVRLAPGEQVELEVRHAVRVATDDAASPPSGIGAVA
jgi:alpha-amylase